jgi:hypothetical protein
MAQAKKDKKVRVRVLPLKGIGGFGDAGHVGWMTKAEADQWVKDGYVEILPDEDEPVPSSAAGEEPAEEQLELSETPDSGDEAEDHKIMKPESKRK